MHSGCDGGINPIPGWIVPKCRNGLAFGGSMPFFNSEHAILEFGLPPRAAISKPAQSVMIVSSACITAIGLALFTFFSRGQLEVIDTILITLAYIGLVDGYVYWFEGVPRKDIFRGLSGVCIAAWGWFGMAAARWEYGLNAECATGRMMDMASTIRSAPTNGLTLLSEGRVEPTSALLRCSLSC